MTKNQLNTLVVMTRYQAVSHLLFVPVEHPVAMPTVSIQSIHKQPMHVAIVGRLEKVQVPNVVQIC